MIIHNNDPGMKFHVMYDPAMQKVDLHMWKIDSQGRRYSPEMTELKEYRIGQYRPPFMALEPEDAQYLANALWEAGIRPVQSNGSSGELGAVKEHLQDARTLRDKLL